MSASAPETVRTSPLDGVRDYIREIGLPRVLIAVFLFSLFAVAMATKMDVPGLVTDSLLRVGRNGLLVLALLPAVQGGVGLNFGLPLGIVCGLLGCVTALEVGVSGWAGLAFASAIGMALAVPVGAGYGWLLNRTRGQEMMVGTYLGFAAVSGALALMRALPSAFRPPAPGRTRRRSRRGPGSRRCGPCKIGRASCRERVCYAV